MTSIGIFIFDDAEELDFVGPYEVWQMVNTVLRRTDNPEPLNVFLISETGEDIVAAKNMRVGAHKAMADISSLDVLCVPGGFGTRSLIQNEAVIDWIGTVASDCEWVTSVCTGAFVLAKAGLTEGKSLTTHWAAFDEFKSLGLEGTLLPNIRYVVDGKLVTAAGVSAGIDMALWLTGQLFTPSLAREVQRAMQYDPTPPYTGEIIPQC